MVSSKKLLYKFVFPVILIILISFIAAKTHIPGTWLSGWDSLHPESDFALAFKRVIFGVWRQEQGLGVLAAHAHMSELPRLIIMWFSLLVFPIHFVRYFYVFLCLLTGVLGLYFFIKESNKSEKSGLLVILSTSFIGSLFYIFNYATLQHFYVPFEMFTTQFALLGWLVLLILKILKDGKNRDYILFFILSLLSAPTAFATTLFYSQFLILITYITTWCLLSRNTGVNFKKAISIIVVYIFVNSYWILPNLYSVITQSKVIENANINRLFSEEAFLSNRAYGDIKSVFSGINHLFSWKEYDFDQNKFVDLLDEWGDYGNNNYYPHFIIFLVLSGIVYTLYSRNRVGLSFIPAFLICLFFLINENPPTGFIYKVLREDISLFREGLRMPFTKFSIPFMFISAYYISASLVGLSKLVSKFIIGKLILAGVFLILILGIVYPFGNYLTGNLTSPSMKVNIPSEYFDFFNYMKGNSGRIAKFPMHTYTGWGYNDWGYQGAGFLSFGIEGSLMDRDFDRWSVYNETFYNEASFALYEQNLERFEQVLKKYDISYLLLDRSVINAGGDDKLLFVPELEDFISRSNHIVTDRNIGFLTVYKTDFVKDNNYISAPESYFEINADLEYSEKDPLFDSYGNYISKPGADFYPFVNFDERTGVEINWNGGEVSFVKGLANSQYYSEINMPRVKQDKRLLTIFSSETGEDRLRLRLVENPVNISIDDLYINGDQKDVLNKEWIFNKGLPGYLEINQSLVSFEKMGGAEVNLGSLWIDDQSDLDISFYSDETLEDKIPKDLLTTKQRLCSDPDIVKNLNVSDDGTFSLKSNREAVCLGGGFRVEKKSLYKFSFDSKSDDNVSANYCISGNTEQNCLEENINKYFKGKENGWSKYEMPLVLTPGNYWFDFVAQGVEVSKEKSIDYKNFKVEYFPETINEKELLNSSDIEGYIAYPIDRVVNKVRLNFPVGSVIKEDFKARNGLPEAKNCNSLGSGSVNKKVTEDGIIYEAYQNAVNCDYFSFPQLKYDTSYVVNFKGENFDGRGIKVYLVNNNTGRSDLEIILPQGKFEKNYVLLSKDAGEAGSVPRSLDEEEPVPRSLDEGGYTLNVETRSFGRIASKNLLSSVSFIPIDTDWLSDITLKGENLKGVYSNENGLEIEEVKKTGTYKYEVKFKSLPAQAGQNTLQVREPSGSETKVNSEGVIALSQGYDKGWIAFTINNKPLTIGKLEHIKVNGWKNGWLIDNSKIKNQNSKLQLKNQNYQRVVIVYWPQYLEFLGFGFVGLAFLMIMLKKRIGD